ncbi:hypothetical protein [Noviherbaspirillum denitrificans]|uniref:TonB-dependent receptor n=1 Tax=Noviherbaspirillum denitrificans TaxID=1968433 RepID=A0A254TDH6_9BURK|nr:hypothetical protein [Noviherbaspirillum denitrificans]OWW20691.1 hypothetical protein AYR66_15560 [Noviherbaspirillum denitrificans]
MWKRSVLVAALSAAFNPSYAAGDGDLEKLREEIRQLRQDYESRIQALEQRLQAAQAPAAQAPAAQAPAAQVAPAPVAGAATGFNPDISAVLTGTYANLSQDPNRYRIQGFIPGGEIGPGKRGFSLGESEVTLSANVDPHFSGQLTFSLSPNNEAGVEEAFFQTKGLANGINVKGGRFLSSIGYQNGQHAHTWDFVDLPLAYQAFLGGQYRPDGLQLKWLAPTERFFELGLEAGDSSNFPGSDRNRNGIGSGALFAHVGDDLGVSASWRAGLSWLRTNASERTYADVDSAGTAVTNAFGGRSNVWVLDAVYKWAPNGNSTHTNFKLQGEYFRRKEKGTLTYDTLAESAGTAAGSYASAQSGWYLQGVYQFRPTWRVGLRYDRLDSGTPGVGLVDSGTLTAADFRQLASFNPSRVSAMVDWSASEFSRLRLQIARDKSRPETTDNQIFLQYIMNVGAHGAHAF